MFKFPHYRLVEGWVFEIMSIMAKINVSAAKFLWLQNDSQPQPQFVFLQSADDKSLAVNLLNSEASQLF